MERSRSKRKIDPLKSSLEWPKEEKHFHAYSQGIRKHRIGRIRKNCPRKIARKILSMPDFATPIKIFKIKNNHSILKNSKKSFSVLVKQRRTRYEAKSDFSKDELFSFLSNILRAGRRNRWNGLDYRKKQYPSGGSLYESKLFLLIERVEGIPPGLYYYSDEKKELHLLKSIFDVSFVLRSVPYSVTQKKTKSKTPQVQVLIAADIRRLRWAYTAISYRIALSNASVLMYHSLLWAETHGFSCFPMGLYPSNVLSQELNISEMKLPLMSQFCLVGKYSS